MSSRERRRTFCGVCWFTRKIHAANPGKRLILVLDNATYNHACSDTAAANALRIQLLYLPPYSPNMNAFHIMSFSVIHHVGV
jgi:transposase